MDFVVTDHISDGRCQAHDLKNRNVAAVHIRDQLLGNNRLKDHGKLDSDLTLLGRFKDIHDTLDGVGSAQSMQTGKNQMAGFCGSHGGLYGFIITHLTQKDYIGALAEGGTKRSQVTLGVGADLSLADNAAVMAVKIFQRIFQGNNVAFPGVVNPVNEAGHSGRFTASGRTGDKDHAACIIRNTHHIFRNGKLCRIRQPEGDHTDHGSQGTTLFISVDTETGDAGNGKRKVIVTGFQKPGYITVFRKCIDGAQKCFRFGWHQSVTTAEKVAINFFGQRTACDDKNIGDPFIGSFCKKFRNWSIHLFILL